MELSVWAGLGVWAGLSVNQSQPFPQKLLSVTFARKSVDGEVCGRQLNLKL